LARSLYKACVGNNLKTYHKGGKEFTLDTAISEYESTMLDRSAGKVKASAEAAKFLHSEVAIMKGDVTRGAAARDFVK